MSRWIFQQKIDKLGFRQIGYWNWLILTNHGFFQHKPEIEQEETFIHTK